jgi:murein hydrolase activator
MIRAILLACLLALPAAADPIAEAEAAAEELRQAGLSFSEAQRAPDRVRALTDTVRAYERGLTVLRDALRDAACGSARCASGSRRSPTASPSSSARSRP